MDAATIVAASIAIDRAVPAAVEEALRQEELRAMQVADLQSYIAQRHFTENLQLPRRPGARLTTWQTAHRRLWNLLMDLRDGIVRAIAHLRWDRIGDAEAVLARLEYEADFGDDADNGVLSDADSDFSHMDSETSSQPAEAPSSGARSLPDEEMSDELLEEGDMQM